MSVRWCVSEIFHLNFFFFFTQSLDEWQLIHEYDVIFLHIVVYCGYEFAFNWPIKMIFTKSVENIHCRIKIASLSFSSNVNDDYFAFCVLVHMDDFIFKNFVHFFPFLTLAVHLVGHIFWILFFWFRSMSSRFLAHRHCMRINKSNKTNILFGLW